MQGLLERVLEERVWIPLYHDRGALLLAKDVVYEPTGRRLPAAGRPQARPRGVALIRSRAGGVVKRTTLKLSGMCES